MKIEKYIPLLLLGLIVWAIGLDLFGYIIPSVLFYAIGLTFVCGLGVFIYKNSLLKYTMKRIGEAFFVIFLIMTATFLLLRTIPGGPFDEEKALPPEIKANIEKKYNLDQPLLTQYALYIGQVVRGDMGESFKYVGRSVTDIIKEALPPSLLLGFYALILAFLMGIPLGLFAAARHNTWIDNLCMGFAVSGIALPNFLVATLLVLFFSLKLQVLPAALWVTPWHYILPVIALGIRPAAFIARLTRSSVLDVIQSDYIRTAKAKGLSARKVLWKHVLKNSLLPVLTFSGPLAAGIMSGSFVIEFIFAIPGLGPHLISSVSNRDYPLILGLTLLYSIMLIFANLIVDLLYTFFDPRIKLS